MGESLTAVQEALNAIVLLKEKAVSAARSAEEASSKANSESGFAFNAKQNAEEHAKAISQVHGTVDAEFAGLLTTKKNVEETVNIVASLRTAAEANARAVAETKSAVEKDALTAKTASERSTAAIAVIDKAQADAATALKDVNSGSAAVALAKTNSDAAFSAIQALQAQLAEMTSKATSDAAAITKIDSDSKSNWASLSKVLVTANDAQQRVTEYESKLVLLTDEFTALNKKIEGLLPNATSAGLASAFRNQKERFKKPQFNWMLTFVITIVFLLITGYFGLASNDSWGAILRHLLSRLPVIIPLAWLAVYAGRNYMLALRLEEEYAFKEAVSTAFEGYKREMSEISASGEGEARPLIMLCENVLRELAQRPGRIYEGRHEDITPLSPVKGIFGMGNKAPEEGVKAAAKTVE